MQRSCLSSAALKPDCVSARVQPLSHDFKQPISLPSALQFINKSCLPGMSLLWLVERSAPKLAIQLSAFYSTKTEAFT